MCFGKRALCQCEVAKEQIKTGDGETQQETIVIEQIKIWHVPALQQKQMFRDVSEKCSHQHQMTCFMWEAKCVCLWEAGGGIKFIKGAHEFWE